MLLTLLSYNNYYNRIIKREDTLTDYETNGTVIHQYETNFKEGDGINTTVVANFESLITPDYAILANDDVVISRWFIIDVSWIRKGQYQITLHRDVIADNLEVFKNSTAFIEKATLPKSSMLNFINEDMTFNQIKVGEDLLKDETKTGWIVGYVAAAGTETTDKTINYNMPLNYDLTASSLESWEYNQYIENGAIASVKLKEAVIKINQNNSNVISSYAISRTQDSASIKGITSDPLIPFTFVSLSYVSNDIIRNLAVTEVKNKTFDFNAAQTSLSTDKITEVSTTQNIKKLSGKILRVGTSEANYQYYKISYEITPDIAATGSDLSVATDSTFYDCMTYYFNNMTYYGGTPNQYAFESIYTYNSLKIILTPISSTLSVVIPAARPMLEDAPYCMFAMPYGSLTYNYGSNIMMLDNDSAAKMAAAIYTGLGSECYDIQLLPFCPFREKLVGGTIVIEENDPRYKEVYKTGTQTVLNFMYWCKTSSFTFNIVKEIEADPDPKVQNETEFIRFNSPNYAASFDFSVAKNNGIDYINVDCTYKPYMPYIHLNPNFKGLYGNDYNDARGLIFSGDFSIPRVDNAWVEYQLQNKNFQASFDRNVESLEFQNKHAKTQDVINAFTGTIQGSVSGAMTGALMSGGNPVGALAGGIAGGVGSAIGGIADVSINEALRNESLDLTRDQFNFNNGNIKARPNTLQKVGALNVNNKIFPFIEYYSATDEEKEILREKLKYNGMRVDKIAKILDFITDDQTYIKGQIIRTEIKDDYRLTTEISNEFNKGVFIKNE